MKRFDFWIGIAIGLALITASWRRWASYSLTETLGYFVFLCLRVAGFLNWRRSLNAQAAAAGDLSKEAAASD